MLRAVFLSFMMSCVCATETGQTQDNATNNRETHSSSTSSRSGFQNVKLWLGGYYENNRKLFAELDVLIPWYLKKEGMFFIDLRAVDFKGTGFEGNAGLGYRTVLNNDWMMGLYGYYDRKKSARGNYFNQATVGLEWKSCRFSATANVYIPFGTTRKMVAIIMSPPLGASLVPASVSGFKNISVSYGNTLVEEVALQGFDIEFGSKIYPFLEAFVGGYAFSRTGVPTSRGLTVRGVYDLTQFMKYRGIDLVAEGKYRWDHNERSNGYVGLRASYVFGSTPRNTKCVMKRFLDRPRRDLDIISVEGTFPRKELYVNQEGTPVLVKIAEDKAGLEEGFAQADIIGVVGQIDLENSTSMVVEGPTLKPGQILSGGIVTLENGLDILVGSQGHIITQQPIIVSRDYAFYELTLENTGGSVILKNDFTNSVGHIVIDNCDFIGSSGCIFMGLTDGSNDSLFTITNNSFSGNTGIIVQNGGDINAAGVFNFDHIDDNVFEIMEGIAIDFGSDGAQGTGASISGNEFHVTSQDFGLINFRNGFSIGRINGNTIESTSSGFNTSVTALDVIVSEGNFSIGQLKDNEIRIDPTENIESPTAIRIQNSVANTTLTIGKEGGVSGNLIQGVNSELIRGFDFFAGQNATIEVDVNADNLTLTQANTFGNVSQPVVTGGSGTVNLNPPE